MGYPDLLFIVVIFIVMYFFILRPKMKEQKEMDRMLGALKKGDKVLTQSGMYADVHSVDGTIVTLKVADNIKIDFIKSAISKVIVDKAEKGEAKA